MPHQDDKDDKSEVKPIGNFSKYHKPDTVGRPGRLYRGEKKYHSGKKDHKGKGKTLRDHRK